MIDIENRIYTAVKTAVMTAYPTASMASEYVEAPSAFPHISLWQMDSSILSNSRDSSSRENHDIVSFQCDVYSNTLSGKKTQAKTISKIIDDVMVGYGFRRTMCQPLPNLDRTIYRITMRYIVIVGTDYTIYAN